VVVELNTPNQKLKILGSNCGIDTGTQNKINNVLK
jgi:hypothetical protein